MKLYASPLSPYAMRNILQCRIKQLPISIEPPPGGMKFNESPEYLAINPIGKIPALVTEEGALPESAVIAVYLEDRFADIPMMPDTAWLRARMHLLIRIADTYVMDVMAPVFGHLDPSTRDQAVVDSIFQEVGKGLDRLERFLDDSAVVAGERLTLADCALVPILKYCEYFYPVFGLDDPFEGRERLAAYWQKIRQQADMVRGLEDMEAELSAVLGGASR